MRKQNKPMYIKQLIRTLSDSWTKTIGAALGILFLVGYYLNAYYFTELGIQELSPLRTQHILTGGVFLFFLCAPGIVLLLPWRLATWLYDANPQIVMNTEPRKRRTLIYAIATFAVLYIISLSFHSKDKTGVNL